MPVGHREKPNWNPAELIYILWFKWGKKGPSWWKLLETSSWIYTQSLFWDRSSLAVTYLLTWKFKVKSKLVCSENPWRIFRSWSQMYMDFFLKGYCERLVASKCCLVTVLNIATICTVKEAMILITYNPCRGNLVTCQVSLCWLWPGRNKVWRNVKNKPALL